MGHWTKPRKERGANLVEFAILAPFLILLLFGIIEFAWLFAKNLDVRHGAREGGRLAATNDFVVGPVQDTCSRMDWANSPTTVISVTRTGNQIGNDIMVKVDASADTLTGLLDWAIPAGTRLVSNITVRAEQVPTWSQTGSPTACP
jgi:Flp pilus assembly protein TadG